MNNFESEQQPCPCCVNLRCKSMFYRADERPGLIHDEEAMGYWCSTTNTDIGPDSKAASHAGCQPGRSCYRDEA